MRRFVDIVVAGLGLLVCLPVLLVLAGLIRWQLGRPVVFRQIRPGLAGRPFELLKFRSMTDGRDAAGALLPDELRLTPFGRFLRANSLDELPQLINVLKGDMSLIGPRPLLMEYLPLFNAHQRRRHEVRPGITGWAQVNGRNAMSWTEKFDADVWYVNNRSLAVDLRILWLTAIRVLRREGISAADNATMPRFTGE